MAEGKVKSIEKTQKATEPSTPTRAFVRQSGVGVHGGGFDVDMVMQMSGNLAVQKMFRAGAIQAKLAISQPGDPDEQQADRVAEQMVSSAPVRTIQRKCSSCAEGTTCPERKEEEKLRLKEKLDNAPRANDAVWSQIDGLRGVGQPLPPSVRGFFEPRFGRDFSQVRVHTDSAAADSAVSVTGYGLYRRAGCDVRCGRIYTRKSERAKAACP